MRNTLNLDALEEVGEELDQEGGVNFISQQKNIAPELDIRLTKALPNMGGVFFLRVENFWIDDKKYISAATFKEHCVMKEEILMAQQKNVPEINELIKKLSYKSKSSNLDKLFRVQYEIPCFVMSKDAKGEFTIVPVQQTAVLQCTKQLCKGITDIVRHRHSRGVDENGEEWAINDRLKGFNITVTAKESKKGDGKEYGALKGLQCEMPEWVDDEEFIYDVVSNCKKHMKTDDYLRSIMRQYLYGEKALAETSRYSDEEVEAMFKASKEGEEDTTDSKSEPVSDEKPEVKMTHGEDVSKAADKPEKPKATKAQVTKPAATKAQSAKAKKDAKGSESKAETGDKSISDKLGEI